MNKKKCAIQRNLTKNTRLPEQCLCYFMEKHWTCPSLPETILLIHATKTSVIFTALKGYTLILQRTFIFCFDAPVLTSLNFRGKTKCHILLMLLQGSLSYEVIVKIIFIFFYVSDDTVKIFHNKPPFLLASLFGVWETVVQMLLGGILSQPKCFFFSNTGVHKTFCSDAAMNNIILSW